MANPQQLQFLTAAAAHFRVATPRGCIDPEFEAVTVDMVSAAFLVFDVLLRMIPEEDREATLAAIEMGYPRPHGS